MSSFHKLLVVGHLGQDPETRTTPGGETVTNCSVASSEKWTDKSTGEMKERTTWFRVAFWGKLAETAGQYLKKGSLVYVEGTVGASSFTGRDGKASASLEVRARELKMLGKAPEGESTRPAAATTAAATGARDYAGARDAKAPAQQSLMDRAATMTDADFDDQIPY